MHHHAPAQEPRAKTIFRLVALALALVAAWPSAFTHPRRDYVHVGSAPTAAAQAHASDAGVTNFIHHLALAVAIEIPVASDGEASSPRERAAFTPFGTLSHAPSSERGPPATS